MSDLVAISPRHFPVSPPIQHRFCSNCGRHQLFPLRVWPFERNTIERDSGSAPRITVRNPCTGCSMAKCYVRPIPINTKPLAADKLGRSFFESSVTLKKHFPRWVIGRPYLMLVTNDSSRQVWVYCLKHKSNADAFRKCLIDACAKGLRSKVDVIGEV